ncbi:helix-turn-helix domain-containing protein [Desulfobacterota bacterium AH_259_B03_O07]|nr:helix-turn-helix domain-containing protein [Desulfobacterota bacterium AH_259_B03_O07]
MDNIGTQLNPKLLDVKALAKYLSLTEWSIRNLVRKQKLPITRIGSRIMFERDSIDAWIRKHSVKEVI